MSFGELLTAPQAWPFGLALLLFFVVVTVEVVLTFSGIGARFGLELDLDLPEVTGFLKFFDWLGIGKVPYLVSLAAFLFCFGFIGLAAQDAQFSLVGHALPWPLVALGATLLSLPIVRFVNRGLGRFWPKDVESSAVSQNSFIGHEAVVVLGEVGPDSAGQIKFRDEHGTTHHALAYSDTAGATFAAGDSLLIVGRRGATYTVIRHPNPSLSFNASDSPRAHG